MYLSEKTEIEQYKKDLLFSLTKDGKISKN